MNKIRKGLDRMKQTVLIAEDEEILREISKNYFVNEGYEVLEAGDGEEALELFGCHPVDLIILDIMMPRRDGWDVCRQIRKQSAVPIIMLTARSDEEDTILGFELGADDYVTKPYSPKILLARAKRLLQQRTQPTPKDDDALTTGNLQLNLGARTVKVAGKDVSLTHTEFEILSYLMLNENMVISREQLIIKIWGYEYQGDERSLNTHIRNLRSKLGACAGMIKTIVRAGYKFEGQS